MCGERSPLLGGTIPAYETFVHQWKHLSSSPACPQVGAFILEGLPTATKYHSLMRHNKTYTYAMCEFHSHLIAVRTNSFVKVVDPCIRFSWITKHWTSDVEPAKLDILNKVGVSTFAFIYIADPASYHCSYVNTVPLRVSVRTLRHRTLWSHRALS